MAKVQSLKIQLSVIVIIVLLQVPLIFSLRWVEDHAEGTAALPKGSVGLSSRELPGNLSSRLRYLHKPSLNDTQDFLDGIKRSLARQENLYGRIRGASSVLFQSPVYPGRFDHAIELQFGSPPQATVLLAVDTGSDLTWMECAPCSNCDPQAAPGMFDPAASSTYTSLSCSTGICGYIEDNEDNGISGSCSSNICHYDLSYMDGSFSSGDIAFEVVTSAGGAGGASKIGNVLFGCGHDNQGISEINGIMGLDASILSFSIQLGKFSFCLLSHQFYAMGQSTPMAFGADANFPSNAVYQSASIVVNPILHIPLYYVNMVSITVNGVVVNIDSSLFNIDSKGDGGVIMDSGTSISVLYPDVFDAIVAQMVVALPTTTYIEGVPCWPLTSAGLDRMLLPSIVFNMDTGSMSLSKRGTYRIVGYNVCLALVKSASGNEYPNIIGNFQMINQFMIFDPQNKKILFSPYDCTEVSSYNH